MAKPASRAAAAACPCGSGQASSRCCRPYHLGAAAPPTAEALMRSRYSGFAKRLPAYLSATWHPSTRPASIEMDPAQRWVGLEVVAVVDGGVDDTSGTVEFVATWDGPGGRGRLHEVSRFERVEGRWHYVDGDHLDA